MIRKYNMAILYFNPGHETAVLNASPYYMAPANVVAMQKELSFLPAWYGAWGDFVLVDNAEDSREYYSFISELFPYLPKPITEAEIENYPDEEVSLWGISPQAIHYVKSIYSSVSTVAEWKEEYTSLHSRQMAKECLERLIDMFPQIERTIIPQFYTELDSIENVVNNSLSQWLAKAPYSSSGRGLLWLPVTGVTRTERQILHGILKKQGSVALERVLDKDTDFAMEFISDGKGDITFEGYSLFYTNVKGAYMGNSLDSQEEIKAQLGCKISLSLLEGIKNELLAILKDKYAPYYKGCIGVDMMIYKENDEYKVHPCLEVNMRYNMGYLALKVCGNYLHPASKGMFKIDFRANERSVFDSHVAMQKENPIRMDGGRLKNGYLPLCPVNKDSHYWAYILVDG